MKHPDGRAWTQDDARLAIGTSLRSYASWERGEASPQPHWIDKINAIFADVTAPDPSVEDITNPRIKQAASSELLAELLARIVAQERQERHPRAVGRAELRAAEILDPEQKPVRVQFMTADAPSANREQPGTAGSGQHNEAQ